MLAQVFFLWGSLTIGAAELPTTLECTLKYASDDEEEAARQAKRPITFSEVPLFKKSAPLAQGVGTAVFDRFAEGYLIQYRADYKPGSMSVRLSCNANNAYSTSFSNGTQTAIQTGCSGRMPYPLAFGPTQDWVPGDESPLVSVYRLECQAK